MITHIFSLKTLFPELLARAEKPVESLPVFFEGKQIAQTSLDENGEFAIVLPRGVESRLVQNSRLWFLPLYDELNLNRDPEKIRLRIRGIRITIKTGFDAKRSRKFAVSRLRSA